MSSAIATHAQGSTLIPRMRIFSAGSIILGRVRGAPIRVHWTTFLAALVFNGFDPPAWLGFLLLVVVHELGHAVFVWRYRYRVTAIEVNGLGGLCYWSPGEEEPTEKQQAVIAWGGVVAQALSYVAVMIALIVAGTPSNWIIARIATVFTTVNVWVMMINLLPIPPLDGAKAWRLLPILADEWGLLRKRRKAKSGPPGRWSQSSVWMKGLAEESARRAKPEDKPRAGEAHSLPPEIAAQIKQIIADAVREASEKKKE